MFFQNHFGRSFGTSLCTWKINLRDKHLWLYQFHAGLCVRPSRTFFREPAGSLVAEERGPWVSTTNWHDLGIPEA